MTDIPEEFRRIQEEQVEDIVHKRLKEDPSFREWIVATSFPGRQIIAIEHVCRHVNRDHRAASGDPLSFGETDIEAVVRLRGEGSATMSAGLLIEMKVDSPQMENQGLRYAARASFRQREGSWEEFRCVLVAPQKYIENEYHLLNHRENGWDCLIALEDVANQLDHATEGVEDAMVVRKATEATNSWNTPIPAAVQFWEQLNHFQRDVFPDVPIFINRQQGAGIFVWPSFFENQLALQLRISI